jgi:hypothetical protein
MPAGDEVRRDHDHIDMRTVHSAEAKLHCIFLCGVSATARGGWVEELVRSHHSRAGTGILARIARSRDPEEFRTGGVEKLLNTSSYTRLAPTNA